MLLQVALVLLIVFQVVSCSKIYLEISQILRSRPRDDHDNDHDFLQSMRSYEQHISDHESAPMILRFADNCGHVCHDLFLGLLSRSAYRLLHPHFALATTSRQQLRQYQQQYPHLLLEFTMLPPAMKLSSELREMGSCSGKQDLLLQLGPLSLDRLMQLQADLRSYGLQVIPEDSPSTVLVVSLPQAMDCKLRQTALQRLTRLTDIHWIEKRGPFFLHNRWTKGLCDSGQAHFTPLNNNNFTGLGEVIGVTDTGLDVFNCYFYDPDQPVQYSRSHLTITSNPLHRKVLAYIYDKDHGDKFESLAGHGTHVSGSALGLARQNYGDYRRFDGVSYDAKIVFYDIQAPSNVNNPGVEAPTNLNSKVFQLQYNLGARVMTNSWGGSDITYNGQTQQVDEFMWNFPDALVLFSAGNEGGDFKTGKVASPGNAKNCATVGAAGNDKESWQATVSSDNVQDGASYDSVAYFSSPGPTADNRMKPDFLAPGFYVHSALGTFNSSSEFCAIQGLSGTSMAAPTAAGFAVKVRQYFLQGFYPSGQRNLSVGFNASGALMKAMLVHSAQPVTYFLRDANNVSLLSSAPSKFSSYPSVATGYGRVELNKALHFGSPTTTNPLNLFVMGGARRQDGHYFAFTATAQTFNVTVRTTSALRVTLAYTDYPSTGSTTETRVNRLALSVIRNSDNQVFTPYNPLSASLSNVQRIDIAAAGSLTTYTLKVTAQALSVTPQPFALVATADLTYLPLGESNAPVTSSYSDSQALSSNAVGYVAVLAVLLFILLVLVWYIRRASMTLLVDVRKMAKQQAAEGYAEEDFPMVEEQQPKKTWWRALTSRQK